MKIEDVFYKLRPIKGKQLDLLWQEYLVAEPPLRKTIEKVLRVQLARQLGETYESEQVLLKPPPEALAKGQYSMGVIYYGKDSYYPFGLREEEFIQHIGIFGRSGSGKTNLAYIILQGLVRSNKPFLVFDWKRNYRDLLALKDFMNMFVFTVGRDIAPFRFNPLMPPPGTPAKVWLKKLIEVMCHAYFLGEGVSILLLRAIDSLYQECGLYSNRQRAYPTMSDVRKWLVEYGAKGRERGWMESSLRAVETLCFGEVGNVLNSGPFLDISRILERQVILELDALTNADKTFLIEALLLWIHHYRMAQEQREKFKHAVVVEEAHHILLRKKQEVTGEETVTDVLLREIRELGESIICLDQHPSLISKPALGNTYTTFTFNLKHRGDLAMMQDCLLLDREQTEYLGRLEVGWAIVKLQGRWFFPFLVRLPHVHLEKGAVTDERLRQFTKEKQKEISCLLSSFKSDSATIYTKEKNSTPETDSKHRNQAISRLDKKEKGKDKNKKCTIKLTTHEEMNFLRDIWLNPASSIKERYQRLCLNYRCGNKIQKSLFSKGIVSSINLSPGKGKIKGLLLTERGCKILGVETEKSNRHGGEEHRFWVSRIAEHLRTSGYEVAKEVPVGGGRTIDIVAAYNDKRIAFEIETGKSNAEANIQKCLAAGMDVIIVLATSAQVRDKIRAVLQKRHNVRLLRVSEFFEKDRW